MQARTDANLFDVDTAQPVVHTRRSPLPHNRRALELQCTEESSEALLASAAALRPLRPPACSWVLVLGHFSRVWDTRPNTSVKSRFEYNNYITSEPKVNLGFMVK